MPVVYGTDIQALLDLPDPEILCSEDTAGAYAVARRWTTPDGALEDIGETEHYDSIDVTEWLGASIDLNDPTVQNDLQSQATQVALAEPYAQGGITVTVTYAGGALKLSGQVTGAPGPFALVLTNGVAGVTAQLLLPGQV